jgi:uncharacterized protein
MRILVEMTHPADVHFFHNAIAEFERHGHQVAVTARQKDVTIALLDNFRIPYTVLSGIGRSKFSLPVELVCRDFRLWKFCRSFRPDVLTGFVGIFASHVGFLLRKPVVVWDDTEHAFMSHMLTFPFTDIICSPTCYKKNHGRKHRFYPGYKELAYLHPKRFKPDIEIVKNLGIDTAQKYCLIRFVSWQAHHDVGRRGFTYDQKLTLVKHISKYAKVYISSEAPVSGELAAYLLNIAPYHIHHIMAFASLCISEGATMASESAVLGVPAVYVNPLKVGYVDEQERYGLLKQATGMQQVLEMSLQYLQDEDALERCRAARQKMLSEKIDVTDYIVQTIEEAAK